MKVGYARVSTNDQSLDAQIDALTGAGVEEGNIYRDKVSGARSERPGLRRLWNILREGDELVVMKLDRFGRSLSDLVEKMEALDEKGVDFRSLTEGIDTTTAQGRLTFHIFGALAEFERELTRERTMAGLQAARERGHTGGRPPALTEEEIPQIVALMRDDDVTTAQICDRFEISRSTLYRYVSPEGERRK